MPNCWGHADFYVSQRFGPSVDESFYGSDLNLIIRRADPGLKILALSSSPFADPRPLSVHGMPASGYENNTPGGYITTGSVTYGTTYRSGLSWREQGVDVFLTSVSRWSLQRLIQLANGCTMIQPSPGPLFPTNQSFPPKQLRVIDWDQPIPDIPHVPLATARAAGPAGAFIPRLGTPTTAFSAPFGSSRHASHMLVFLYDLPKFGRVLVYEYPAQTPPQGFDQSIRSIATNHGQLGSSGYYKILAIRAGQEALLSVGNGDAPSSVEWLENGLEVILAGRSINGNQALALAARV